MNTEKNMKEILICLLVSLAVHGFVFSALAYVHYGKKDGTIPLNFVDVSLEMGGLIMEKQGAGPVSLRNRSENPGANKRSHQENMKPAVQPVSPSKACTVNTDVAETANRGPENSTEKDITASSGSENIGTGSDSASYGISGGGKDTDSSGQPGALGSSDREKDVVKKASPLYSHNPPPLYPQSARVRRLEGTVELNVLVDTKGRVRDLNLRRSSGYKVLDRAAMDSVKEWRFEPGKTSCCPMEMWVVVPMVFKLTQV
ncbi:MAG: energy transducer TonB [Desulfobacteraceae bacterium]|jgi:TonB family protein